MPRGKTKAPAEASPGGESGVKEELVLGRAGTIAGNGLTVSKYKLHLTLIDSLLGTVPDDPEVYAKFIANRAPTPALAAEEIRTATPPVLSEEEAAESELLRPGKTTFHRDDNGDCFLYNYMIRGFLKDAGNAVKADVGVQNLKSKITQMVFASPRRIGIEPPFDVLARSLRAQTQQGPRVTIAVSDMVSAGATLDFDLFALKHPELTEVVIGKIFDYGQFQGLGQWRTGGYGRFLYTMEKVAVTTTSAPEWQDFKYVLLAEAEMIHAMNMAKLAAKKAAAAAGVAAAS